MFCDAKIRRKNGTTKLSNLKLVKERLCYYSDFCLFHRFNQRDRELSYYYILYHYYSFSIRHVVSNNWLLISSNSFGSL